MSVEEGERDCRFKVWPQKFFMAPLLNLLKRRPLKTFVSKIQAFSFCLCINCRFFLDSYNKEMQYLNFISVQFLFMNQRCQINPR